MDEDEVFPHLRDARDINDYLRDITAGEADLAAGRIVDATDAVMNVDVVEPMTLRKWLNDHFYEALVAYIFLLLIFLMIPVLYSIAMTGIKKVMYAANETANRLMPIETVKDGPHKAVSNLPSNPSFVDVFTRWFDRYWHLFLSYPQVYIYIYLGFGFYFVNHFATARADGEHFRFLAELPWRRPWPWLVTTLLGPFGAMSMIHSYRRLPADLDARQAQERLAMARPTMAERHYGLITIQTRVAQEQEWPNYQSSPQIASAVYGELRLKGAAIYRRERLVEIEEDIAEVRDELIKAQQELGELMAEQAVLERNFNEDEVPPMSEGEFERIVHLPGVMAVQVVDNRLRLIVRANCLYDGRTYDLGDWCMDFGADTLQIKAIELRTGLIGPSRSPGYPAYRLEAGIFCFGSRVEEIDRHIIKMQYLEAAALAVECLNTINDEHQAQIPTTFKEVRE